MEKELKCPLCDLPSDDGKVHLNCAKYEQAIADLDVDTPFLQSADTPVTIDATQTQVVS